MNTKEIDTFPATMHTTDWYFTAISVSIDVDFAYIPMRDFFLKCVLMIQPILLCYDAWCICCMRNTIHDAYNEWSTQWMMHTMHDANNAWGMHDAHGAWCIRIATTLF